jgi:nitrogen fixation/metabolism regulation signal transduction histidine kinase
LRTEILGAAIDALPHMVLVVDDDVRIRAFNAAAGQIFQSPEGDGVLLLRGGEAMRCVNALQAPEGCGHTEACQKCPVRSSVNECFQTSSVSRTNLRLEVASGTQIREGFFRLTVAPLEHGGERLAVLTLEDLGEVVQLRRMVPICAFCHRVRSDRNYWEDVERFASSSLGVDWTHGICEECLEKHFAGGEEGHDLKLLR